MATASFTGDGQSAAASGGGSSGSSSSSSSSGTSSSSGGQTDDAQIRRYAASMMKQYDKNANAVLEKEEWSQSSTISSHPERFDKNGDGKITMDELVDGLKNWNRGADESSASAARSDSASSSGSGSSRSASSGSAATDASVGASTGRGGRRGDGNGRSSSTAGSGKHYLTPKDRLPEGLPDWFLHDDADGDGQVSLHEFASPLTEEKIAEFNKYDLNGDGFITPEEVLKVLPPKK
jgi:Ca2+-binding EF-hand superfamily protein